MRVNEYQIGEIQVMAPHGRIDSLTSENLDKTLQERLGEGISKLLIDFSHTDFISSAGLRVLLMAAKKAKAVNCKLRLCGLNDILRDIFEVSGFVSLFAIDPTVQDSQGKF